MAFERHHGEAPDGAVEERLEGHQFFVGDPFSWPPFGHVSHRTDFGDGTLPINA